MVRSGVTFPVEVLPVRVWTADAEDLLRQNDVDHLLSESERRRISNTPACRRRPRMASYVLRRIALSEMMGCATYHCAFGEDGMERPMIEQPVGARDLSLSMSRSGNCVAVGLGQGASVGIDIEHARYTDEQLEFVARTFNRAEQLMADAYGRRSNGVLAVWTIKEAIGKAQGFGIATLPDSHGFSPHFGGVPQALRLGGPKSTPQTAFLAVYRPRPDLWMSIAAIPRQASSALKEIDHNE